MLLSLKELGIPDYSYSEWLLLPYRSMFSESLVIHDNGESMSSKPKDFDLWIDVIKRLAFPKTSEFTGTSHSRRGSTQIKKVLSKEKPVAFKLYDGWDSDLSKAVSYDEFFSVLERIDASYIPVLNNASRIAFDPYSLAGRFPDTVYSSDIRSKIIKSVKDTIDRIGGSDACINHDLRYYHPFPERLRSLELLDDLVSKNPPGNLRLHGWDADRAVYPYYISLKREHNVRRGYLF